MNTNTVQITLQFKDDGTIAVVDQAKGKVQELNKTVDDSKGPLAGISEAWLGMTAKIAVATAAIYGVISAISSHVSLAAEAEQINSRLGYAVETAGHSYGYYKTQIDQWAESVMKSTRFSSGEARQALNDMFLYTTNLTKAEQGATLAMDMATRKGMDLGSATRYVGMAMTGNIEILGRMLPEFRNLTDILGQNVSMDEKAAYAMKILNEKFGGTASKDIETYSGKVKQFENSWKELKESIGKDALPALSAVFDWLKQIVDKMREQRELAKEAGTTGFWGGWGKAPPGSPYMTAPSGYPTESEKRFTGWGAEKAEVLDPYVRMYGMTEAELQDRLSRSKLSYQGWLEDRTEENKRWLAEQQSIMDTLGALRSGAELTFPTEDILPDLMQITNQYGEILTVNKTYYDDISNEKLAMAELLATVRMLKDATGAEFTFPTEDILPDWVSTTKGPQLVERWKNQMTDMQTATESGVTGIANIWGNSFSSMRRSQESFSDWFKNLWTDMADYVIGQIQKMALNYLLLGSMSGKTGGTSFFGTSAGGYGGLVGGLLSLVHLQEGGQFWVNRPTPLLVGEGGGREFVSVTPEGKMGQGQGDSGGGGTTVIMYIEATDVDSFERKYGGSVTKIIHRNEKSGMMR